MSYYIYLFSPQTFYSFSNTDKSVSGVRSKQRGIAAKIMPGDKLVCYVTKLSRWVGLLEVTTNFFVDDKPIFTQFNDPFTIRFNVTPRIWLALENGIPIHDEICWDSLSFTKSLPEKSLSWTPMVRTSLRRLMDEDGVYLEKILTAQHKSPKTYELSEVEKEKMRNDQT